MVRHAPTNSSEGDHLVLGRALRSLRRAAGLTQPQLGERANIGVSYLSQLENGHRGVGWHTVMRLLRALDCDLRELSRELERTERE
jgi:transcriptional regulator with XRE-family HTH domain